MNKKTLAVIAIIIALITTISFICYFALPTPEISPTPEPTPTPLIELPIFTLTEGIYSHEEYNSTSKNVEIHDYEAILITIENRTSFDLQNYWIRWRILGMTKWDEMDVYSFFISDAGKIYNGIFVNDAFINNNGYITILWHYPSAPMEFQVSIGRKDWSESQIVTP